MIIVAFGCDKCGTTAQKDLQRRANWDEAWIRMPEGWSMQDGFLLCGSCTEKIEVTA